MDKLIDNFPYKKILFLNWYEAALAHLLLFKYLVEKHANNVYFLISEQGILLKATSLDYLKKADDEINKFFTAKIEELQISGSADFYNHIIEDIKEQTDKLKENRDCPYINLVYSDKFRNSCLAMKKHGYTKPYENWQCHERQKKGFCFLIVRPEHRWKEIASNVYTLVRKRQTNHKTNTDVSWPVNIGYEKFIWFYLKQSFKKYKKSLEIKENKAEKRLTIVIKRDISELNDLEKQIDSLNYFYRPTRPQIEDKDAAKIICLSSLEVQKITQLIYHQFGLPNFVKELRKKMSGYLVIGSIDITQYYESIDYQLQTKVHFRLEDKEDISKISQSKINTVIKLDNRYSIISYEGINYVQFRLDKPIKENMEKILKIRLPSLPKYYYWYEKEDGYYIIRSYFTSTFTQKFQKLPLYDQIFMMYSLIGVVEDLHERHIYAGNGIKDSVYVQENRIIIEPQQSSTKERDMKKLKEMLIRIVKLVKDEERREVMEKWVKQQKISVLGEYLEEWMDTYE